MISKSQIKKMCMVMAIFLAIAYFGITTSEAKDPAYPQKPIVIIVPFPPGGATDLVPRIYAPVLSKRWGVPIMIVNKPGGSGIVGVLEAMKASPDGYILMSDVPGASSSQSVHGGELPYKVENRTFIARIVSLPMTIVVRADSPWKNLDDVAEAIRKDPTNFKWGGAGGTTIVDVGLLQLKKAFAQKGIDLSQTKDVQFQGSPVITALGGGHVDISCGTFAMVGSMASAGKIRIIAVNGTERYKGHPDIKTTAEQGYPSVDCANWIGLSGPPGLAENIVQTWGEGLKEVFNEPQMVENFAKIGAVPSFLASDGFKKFVLDEIKVMKALYK